ncbi:MAG: Dna2/Cas4 domain-containing protein [Thermoprotei archaeon]
MLADFFSRKNRPFKRVPGEYWPSQIFSCMRRQYYSLFIPEQHPSESLAVFEVGEMYHRLLGDILEEWAEANGAKVSREVPVRIPHGKRSDAVVSGRADDVLIVYAEKRRYIVEVKTIQGLVEQARQNLLPRREHVGQLNLYLRAFPGSTGVILYLERSSFKAKQYFIEYSDELYNEAMDRVERLHEYLHSEQLPPPEQKKGSEAWKCRLCFYKEACSADMNPALSADNVSELDY